MKSGIYASRSALASGSAASCTKAAIRDEPAAGSGIGPTSQTIWTDTLRLTADAAGTQILNTVLANHLGVLEVGASYVRTADITVPNGFSGPIFVTVETKGPFGFIHTDNNTAVSAPIRRRRDVSTRGQRSWACPLTPLVQVGADGSGTGGVFAVEAGVVGEQGLVVADGFARVAGVAQVGGLVVAGAQGDRGVLAA